jgi:hypothetical protein
MNERKFFIAGVQHRPGAADVIRELSEGDELVLVPEPDNKFDPNAVKIELQIEGQDAKFLGYVPKKFSAEVAAALEVGKDELECVITKINKNGKTYEMCEVVIKPAADDNEEYDDEEPCPICGEDSDSCTCDPADKEF